MGNLTVLADELIDKTSSWNLEAKAKGRCYKTLCAKASCLIQFSSKAGGKQQCKIKLSGKGVILSRLTSDIKARYINTHRGKGKAHTEMRLYIKALGKVCHDSKAGHKAGVHSVSSSGSGRNLKPIWETCDLNILLPYITNFLPEIGEQLPAPLPTQDRVKLHVLDRVIKSQSYHGDTEVWTLMAVSYMGKPAMLLRNLPGSHYPTRHITDDYNFKLMLGYLAFLWEVRPIVTGAIPGPIMKEHIIDLYRQRHKR